MGLYDSVLVKCINKECDEKVEFQSKVGDCNCNEYNIKSVPIEIARDINGKIEQCYKCGYKTTISIAIHIPDRVPMMVD